MRNILHKSCRGNQNFFRKSKRTFCVQYLFQKSCRVWDNLEEYCTAGQATGSNMAPADFMLDT